MSFLLQVILPAMLSLFLLLSGCAGSEKVVREIIPKNTFQDFSDRQIIAIGEASPFLKIHMTSGRLYVLHKWSTDATGQNIVGHGTLFNTRRDSLRAGSFTIGIDSVAIFETNSLETSPSIAGLAVLTGISVGVTIACLANPKACFGSCPTFYTPDGDSQRLQAEGFSASIAPALEATDIDAIFHRPGKGETFSIEMKNEALETHVVRYVNLLAAPRASGHRIFSDPKDGFWEVSSLMPPTSAWGPEGDCRDLLASADQRERLSRTDSTDLATKEMVELAFDSLTDGQYGLVIGCRQSLLSTYLLYQTYAYMGTNAGFWVAQITGNKVQQHENSIQKLLGGIEILMQDSLGNWTVVDQVLEYGPLASDFHILPLGQMAGKSTKIRLNMTRGNWRIDYAALAEVTGPVKPQRIYPETVSRTGQPDRQALASLTDSASVLVTLPGDAYQLTYMLPGPTENYELFLESRGYYLEWIRKEWIAEENSYLLGEMFLNPGAALKRLAPAFKQVEAEMEGYFWRSRYARP